MSIIVKTEHPYIVQIEDVCGGRPVIKGARTSVQAIAGYYKLGMSIEEIMDSRFRGNDRTRYLVIPAKAGIHLSGIAENISLEL